jgi:hypothetical protein
MLMFARVADRMHKARDATIRFRNDCFIDERHYSSAPLANYMLLRPRI